VFCDADFTSLRAAAEGLHADGPLAHLLLVDNPEHHPEGDFHLDAAGLLHADGAPRLTFSGLGAYHPALFAALADDTPAKLAPLLRAAMNAGQVTGRHHAGRWIDVGTPRRLADLDCELQHKRPS
ncbi:MAG TPA: mannose-1-phosphate guanylyltransferase, partial [Thauera aminoaromatica]|nr:mannose-1-phosphate guanylyltransferase [Thauera aminoaromatica]